MAPAKRIPQALFRFRFCSSISFTIFFFCCSFHFKSISLAFPLSSDSIPFALYLHSVLLLYPFFFLLQTKDNKCFHLFVEIIIVIICATAEENSEVLMRLISTCCQETISSQLWYQNKDNDNNNLQNILRTMREYDE